ncbi:MAG: hypothetical protein QME35_01575 [Thermoanaerobacteraceae bacterium]|nr:hypothetical protein [Thermoanaerobacteraceae bacterium]
MKGFQWLTNVLKKILGNRKKGKDKVSLTLYGLNITVEREININLPHEITVVVPRVECRKKYKNNEEEIEIIMNSITVVHSPRHEPSKPSSSPLIPKK